MLMIVLEVSVFRNLLSHSLGLLLSFRHLLAFSSFVLGYWSIASKRTILVG